MKHSLVQIRASARHAFTLIELSIVLVIIGLVVGGILTGQTLIRGGIVKSQLKQIQDYQTAVYAFQSKYNCIPGDCANATTFFGTTDPFGNPVNNGNGNGLIDTQSGAYFNDGVSLWASSKEMWGAFQQLSIAGMIGFVPSNPSSLTLGVGVPQLSINPGAGFFLGAAYNFYSNAASRNPAITSYQKGNNAIWMVDCNPGGTIAGWDNLCAAFTASDLQQMDQKIDDGLPLSGNFFGFGGYSTNNDCLNISGSASTYKISNTTAQCQAAYVIN